MTVSRQQQCTRRTNTPRATQVAESLLLLALDPSRRYIRAVSVPRTADTFADNAVVRRYGALRA